MPSVSKSFGGLLKGSDLVEAKKDAIFGVILQVRHGVQGISSPAVIDFDTEVLPGISSWGCNITELRRISEMTGIDETGNWKGWGLGLAVADKKNPQTGQVGPGLVAGFVMKPQEVAKKRKTKPTVTPEAARKSGVASTPTVDWEKVPF